MRYLSDRYRPELHYMRGPGPKWLEKHAGQSGAIVVPSEGHQMTSTLTRRIELTLRRWLPARGRIGHGATHEPQWALSDRLGPWSVGQVPRLLRLMPRAWRRCRGKLTCLQAKQV